MTESKKNIELTNGWILCPSKSFPGKFYYFNVLNGEAAWSLNQSDKKGCLEERSFHKIADKSHGYPEPTKLPHNIFTNTKKLDFPRNIPHNHQLPKFGKAAFPKYVNNVEPLIPNIVCNSVPFLMFCAETEKPMLDQKLSEFEHLTISQSSKQTNIPLCKRFKNYQKPCFSLDRNNKIVKQLSKFKTSTPKNLFMECISESRNFFLKSLIKKPTLKLEPKSPTPKFPNIIKSNAKGIIHFSGKVESTKFSAEVPKLVTTEENLENLDSSDLRFLLLAKRRSIDAADAAVERKKPKPTESKPLTLKKKVTFNLKDETADDDTTNDKTQQDFIPLTPNLIRTIVLEPKSPVVLKDKTSPSFIKVSPKTPPPNVEDQPPTLQPTAIYQPPTFQPTANYQPPTLQLTANYQPPTLQPTANYQPPTLQPTDNYQRPTFKNTTWYIVVDTDVLLLDYEMIDKIVLSDPKCRLIIPHAVAADIENLCMGDCRGQQRVINARQLTRKLATPPPHYIVEPRTIEGGNIVVTTDSILHCCMKVVNKNYYVFARQCPSHPVESKINNLHHGPFFALMLSRTNVLITNDPHLQIRATLLNIQSHKLNEIKYGVRIKPNITPEKKNIKIITRNDDVTDTKNQFNQSIFSKFDIKPEITSEKKIKIASRNDVDGKNQYNNNLNLLSYNASPIKMQLFLSSDSETDSSLDCDKLITTQPKGLKNIENINKSEIDGLSDISSEVSSLNLSDKNFFKPQNVGRNPFLSQNVKENGLVNFEKRVLNPNTVYNNAISFRRTVPNEKPVSKPNHENHDFQKNILEYNFENTENPFRSIPITNMKLFESKPKLENSVKPDTPSTCLSLQQEPSGVTRAKKILNPSQTRIQKIIKTINNDSTTKIPLENQIPKTKDSTGLFKIPQLLPIKNATRYTSVHVENLTVNDEIGTRTNIDSIDENLTRFRIKSRNMKNKIKTRIDEWLCSYMQIMEDTLMHILQKNCICMENTVAPLTLKDTLNCIKMLFSGHTKIRDYTKNLSELLEKSMLCTQGKSKVSLIPEDFMKIFGYGVLLVQVLKNIHPQNEELKEAEVRLNNLQINLESNTKEFDPELVKSPSLSKSEVDQGLEEIRPQFIKMKSYVIEYLKKHFKEWENYKEDLENQNHKIENHTDFKVVRTLGKNLNLLKIDNKKMMTLSNNTLEEDLANKSKDRPKLIRLLENNHVIKPDITENVDINRKNETKLIGRSNNKNNHNDFDYFLDENENKNDQDVPLKKLIENIEKEQSDKSKVNKEFNYTTHENTFLENTEKDGPKIIRNIKLIDEFENKFNKNKEPLDLDLFYSEIYEPSVDGNNIDFDVISEKNKNSQDMNKNNHFEGNNYGLENTICTLEDFYITPSISSGSKNNNNTSDFKDTENSSNKIKETKISKNVTSRYVNSIPENNDKNANIEEKTDRNNCEVESETYTENQESHNESCIGNGNSEKYIDNSKTPNNDSGTHLDNSDTCNDNFFKKAQSVRDDSTNDSGFENDSTYAHSLVKIFLNELSTTFKVIHTFVTKFIDEIRETELSGKRKDALHTQASKALEDMVAIIQQLKSIIKRESAENTVLKMLLRNAGVEATTDKRMTRYRQIVIKCLGQAVILESALKVIVSTTIGDFEALSTNAETLNSNLRYFNIFE